MRIRSAFTGLVVTALLSAGSVVLAPTASAYIDCGNGESYERTDVNSHFVAVDSVTAINMSGSQASITVQVGAQHTSSRAFTGSITVGAEAGFWVFAKAKAEASGGVTIETSDTMFATYSATVAVPAHSTRTVTFGFRKYDQYVRSYHLVNTSQTTCGKVYDQ